MDVALLLNPAARSGAHSEAAEKAAGRLRAAGIRTTLVSGGSAAESVALLRTALRLGADAVLVAGGDGTVHLAVQELAGTGIPLGILPIGTGNDLATALGLRELDGSDTVAAMIAGATKTIDLARITRADGSTTLFATVLASGFDSKVNDRANRMRWPRGHSRYTIALLREFVTLRGSRFEVELELPDGAHQKIVGELLMATVGNGPTYGGGIPISPDARLDDGLLDVTLVRPAGRFRLLRLLPRVYRGTHTSAEEVSTYRVSAVHIDAPGITAYADGDPVGALPLRVDAVAGALTVFAA